MNLETIRNVLIDQQKELFTPDSEELVREVDLEYHLRVPEVSVITGVRRCGKSTLLRQLARRVKEDFNIHYLNFEEQRLDSFDVDDFRIAYEEFLSNVIQDKKQILIYDEIQNVPLWEKWISSIANKKNIKIFITGSNSSLLSSELSSLITGRHVDLHITPLSFKESLQRYPEYKTKNIEYSTDYKLFLKKSCDEYFKFGGFPRALLYQDTTILGNYYEDIVERDIALRKKVRNIKALKNLGRILASQNGRMLNQSNVSKDLSLKSVLTTNKFINYFKETFLYSEIKLYSKSAKKQTRGHSKFYAVDPILAKKTGLYYGDTLYWELENHVFNELSRRGYEISYWHPYKGLEVDFIARDKEGIDTIIQVCVDLSQDETYKREIRAIEKAKVAIKTENCLIISYFEQDAVTQAKCPYKIVPFYSWASNY